MGWRYLDENGKEASAIMGCYGLGVTRLLAALIEEHHDERGIRLPISVAPYQVHIVPLNYQKDAQVKEVADQLYASLRNAGIEVLLDDRKVKAGPQFADADLLGMPIRITVSKRTLENSEVEVQLRRNPSQKVMVSTEAVETHIEGVIQQEYASLR